MFVEVSNYHGSLRVRIMHQVKIDGKWKRKLIEHIGSTREKAELELLKDKAKQKLDELKPQSALPLWSQAPSLPGISLSQPFAWGLWQVIGGIYDRMGLPTGLLKYLVLARIALPKSKRATARYLVNNLGYTISTSAIYKYMDSLSQSMVMDKLLAYAKTKATNQASIISIVFYDVTTLYFENDQEDEDVTTFETLLGLRKYGYSKDHRADQPQVVIGLTVDGNGFPLDFQVYRGNTYEGNTLLKGVSQVSQKLNLPASQLTVVADAGMLNATNLYELDKRGYHYIVGARLKSMSKSQTKVVLAKDYQKTGNLDTKLKFGDNIHRRLIVTYSDKRAQRHRQNRNRVIQHLQARLARGDVVKKSKYVSLDNDKHKLTGRIDIAKVGADARFDGLKGYITSTKLTVDEIVDYYSNLWQVEKSFRMSKTDLKARPAFHYRRQRIIAHLTICVCALAVLREFNQKLTTLATDTDGQPVGQSIALEQLLAIWRYQLNIKEGINSPIYSETNKLQKQLLDL